MNLTETEEAILDQLYANDREEGDGAFVLHPVDGREADFEKSLKRLDLGGFIEIEDRFGDNKAILQLTSRGKRLCAKRAGDVEVRTRTIVVEEIETWDEPPRDRNFVRFEDLEAGDRFEDKTGHEWEVPKQADNPDEAQRILNRTATDFRRGTPGYVPEGAYVRKVGP